MSVPDYDIHIPDDRWNALWNGDDEVERFPFGEDDDEIDRIIAEEIGPTRKRGKKSR